MDTKVLVKYFLTWRVLLFVFMYLSLQILNLQFDFLGGGLSSYLRNPHLFSWLNFDGEHYLAISQRGYREFEYFYFPGYPLLVSLFASLFNLPISIAGLIISNLSFLTGLIGLVKLVRLDYDDNITFWTIVLILVFPTSFYFASFYSESIFFALVAWSFYFARKKRFLLAGVIAAYGSFTRLVGLALSFSLLIEVIENSSLRSKSFYQLLKSVKHFLAVSISFFGLIIYMSFLRFRTGDFLEFLHNVSIFGPQRSSRLVLLPQVFYRYVFKILPNVDYSNFANVFTTWLEFVSGFLFFTLAILALFKFFRFKWNFLIKLPDIRISYISYLILGYITPTLSGSFSSLPRYILVLFPGFILLAGILQGFRPLVKSFVFIFLFFTLAIATSLFVRGYWIS